MFYRNIAVHEIDTYIYKLWPPCKELLDNRTGSVYSHSTIPIHLFSETNINLESHTYYTM